jgi:hypothetical protein
MSQRSNMKRELTRLSNISRRVLEASRWQLLFLYCQ